MCWPKAGVARRFSLVEAGHLSVSDHVRLLSAAFPYEIFYGVIEACISKMPNIKRAFLRFR